MATYKVLQDIEAEDKLFGPFTLKQFIFGGITVVLGFIGFRIVIAGAPMFITIPILLVMLPFFLLFGFLAAPIGRDQSTETWLLARLRFLFKPRTRIWNQDGIKELVTITVPKKIERVYTKDFTQDEVRSRLKALANTVDSRGWAVKNVNANLFNQPDYVQVSAGESDRLVDPSNIPQEVPMVDVLASDDIFDVENNPIAQHFDQMTHNASTQIRQEAIQNMNNANQTAQPEADAPTNYYFMHENQVNAENTPQDYSTFVSQNVVTPGTASTPQVNETPEEQAFAHQKAEEKKHANDLAPNHGKVLQPIHDEDGNIIRQPIQQPEINNVAQNQSDTVQNSVNPAIIGVAGDNWYVDTVAREAKKMNEPKKPDDEEVVISLH